MAPEDSGPPQVDTPSSQTATATSSGRPSYPISIPGYVIERQLGQGGMGAVYLARDAALGRRVALKVVLEARAGDEESRSRFRREARTMASVEHPNVVRLYAFGSTPSSDYLVMEYVEGETLATRLSRSGPLPESEALRVLREMLQGLEAAWEKGVVHRDVKPSNVLLDAKGRARVADFGLAKSALRAGEEASLTADQSVLGTPHYLSPEQAQGRAVDFRSDIYSAGLVFFEMLTGERPFPGATPAVVVARRLTEGPPDLAAMCPGLSERTLSVYRWMVNRAAELRPASYAELISALDGHAAPAEPLALSRKRRLATPLATGLLFVVGVAAVVTWQQSARFGPPTGHATLSSLVVAIAPFYGPDETSAREGQVMAALVQGEVSRRLGTGARVVGPDETRTAVRDHAAARSLGERVGAAVVIWGEAFVVSGESEIQPYFTLVPPKRENPAEAPPYSGVRERATLEGLGERAAGPVVFAAQATNQVGLRRTGAAGIGDLVLVLAGVQALYAESRPEKALGYFEQAPRNSESLRYRAEALERLGRFDDALAMAREAVASDPKDASAQAQLGDCALRAGLLEEAVAAHRRAAETGKPYTSHRAIFSAGLLYVRDTYRNKRYMQGKEQDTGYLLACDPVSGRVVERHRCPGIILAMRPTTGAESFEITYPLRGLVYDDGEEGKVVISRGRFERPVFESESLLLRRLGINSGLRLASNFWDVQRGFSAAPPAEAMDDAPQSLLDLERALRAAEEHDPTQPWTPFLLGQAMWAQRRRDEAASVWERMLTGTYSGTPYYEYAWMAMVFEKSGQPAWADRAFEQSLVRRHRLPYPVGFATVIERLIIAPCARGTRGSSDDRAFTWWQRGNALTGVPMEGNEAVSALWSRYWRGRGDATKAAVAETPPDRSRAPSFTHLLVDSDIAWFGFAVAVLAFWITLIAFAVRARPLRDRPIARLGSAPRHVLLFAWIASLVASIWLAESARQPAALVAAGFSYVDGAGSGLVTSRLDALLARSDVPERRWVAAVAHHLAGDRDRATELYRSLPGDERATQNLEALERGSLAPPVTLTSADLQAAYAACTWPERVVAWVAPGRVYRFEDSPDLVSPVAWLTSLVGLVIAIAFARSRSPSVLRPPSGGDGARRLLRFTPGLGDLSGFRVWRGYLTLVLLLFPALVAAMQITALSGFPRLGPFSAESANVFRAFAVPSIYSPAEGEMTAAGRWWVLLAYPHAPAFIGLAVTAALACVALHLYALRGHPPVGHAAAEKRPAA